MTPFQQFRVWLRRASAGDRAGAAVVVAVALGLLAWVFVPAGTGSGGSSSSSLQAAQTGTGASTGTAGHAPAESGSANTAPGTASGTLAGVGAGGAPSASGSQPGSAAASGAAGGGGSAGSTTPVGGAQGCVSPPGADQGVTATQIKVSITLNEIVGPAGNSTYGLATPQEQQEDYQQVIDAINASGGVACRKLVPLFYTGNSADQSGLQQICLEIAQAGVLMEIDTGAYYAFPALADCFPQHQIPFLSTAWVPSAQNSQFFPYLFPQGSMEVNYRNTVLALHQLGFFSPAKGFTKLGILYRDCVPLLGEVTGWLNQAGVSSSQIVTYDVGCPAAFATPDQLEQAVLKFQTSGVHQVTELEEYTDFSNFTTIAQQQGFTPHYGIPDDGVVAISYGSQHPDYANIANAIAITAGRFGEEDTPGLSPSPATAKCNAIYASHGRPSVYRQPVGTGGTACDQLWEAVAAIGHAAVLHRDALATGLQAARSVDFSYPGGPNDFAGTRVTYGDEFWRPDQFFTTCNCWRVIDPTFHPSFP